jgi:hypothetical protein
MDRIQQFERSIATKKVAKFGIGDTVVVSVRYRKKVSQGSRILKERSLLEKDQVLPRISLSAGYLTVKA